MPFECTQVLCIKTLLNVLLLHLNKLNEIQKKNKVILTATLESSLAAAIRAISPTFLPVCYHGDGSTI